MGPPRRAAEGEPMSVAWARMRTAALGPAPAGAGMIGGLAHGLHAAGRARRQGGVPGTARAASSRGRKTRPQGLDVHPAWLDRAASRLLGGIGPADLAACTQAAADAPGRAGFPGTVCSHVGRAKDLESLPQALPRPLHGIRSDTAGQWSGRDDVVRGAAAAARHPIGHSRPVVGP